MRRRRHCAGEGRARIAAVGRVVDRAAGVGDDEGEARGDGAAELIEARCVGVGSEAVGLHLAEEDGLAIARPFQKHNVHFAHHWKELIAHFHEAVGDARAGERAAVEEMFLDAVGPEQAELGAGAEAVVKQRDFGGVHAGEAAIGIATAGHGEGIERDRAAHVAHAVLGVPDDEAPRAGGAAVFAGVPVVARPIAHRGVSVEDAVVGEVGEVEPARDVGVNGGVGDGLGVDVVGEVVEIHAVAVHYPVAYPARPDDVPLVSAAEVFVQELFADALAGIIPRPEFVGVIDAVDKHDGQVAGGSDAAHVLREAAMKFIADERVVFFAETGAQDNLIEASHAGPGKEWIVQPSRAVVAAEKETEGKFIFRRLTRALEIAAVHAQTAIHLEAGVVRRLNPFHGGGPLPSHAALRRVVIVARRVRCPGVEVV